MDFHYFMLAIHKYFKTNISSKYNDSPGCFVLVLTLDVSDVSNIRIEVGPETEVFVWAVKIIANLHIESYRIKDNVFTRPNHSHNYCYTYSFLPQVTMSVSSSFQPSSAAATQYILPMLLQPNKSEGVSCFCLLIKTI